VSIYYKEEKRVFVPCEVIGEENDKELIFSCGGINQRGHLDPDFVTFSQEEFMLFDVNDVAIIYGRLLANTSPDLPYMKRIKDFLDNAKKKLSHLN
jgi:hypothetical protein